MIQRYLVLEDGTVYAGLGYGGQKTLPMKVGEVVFNTAHSGYEEIATDPSYMNQIIVMTAPMMGNYGADKNVWESRQLWIQGFVCLQLQDSENNHSWAQRLVDHEVPILTSLDTRELVIKLRSQGTTWGTIVEASSEAEAKKTGLKNIINNKTSEKDWVWLASRKQTEIRKGQNASGPRVAVLDFGAKENILRELEARCSEIKIFSSRAEAKEILEWKPDGVMLTNGPGDPSEVQKAPETIKSLLGQLPVFGICMGHQVLSIALGAKTYKLKFGHRGANHPIKDAILNSIYMSSQNHGYAVDPASLPKNVQVTQVNLNDNTVAGFFSESLNCLGIQYHPESRPGPHDATPLFDFFTTKMIKNKGRA